LYKTDYAHANFTLAQGGASYLDGQIGAALTLRQGRRLVLRLRVDHFSRAVSDIADFSGFRANTVFLTVGNRPQSADTMPN
jgi:hypothetical protein